MGESEAPKDKTELKKWRRAYQEKYPEYKDFTRRLTLVRCPILVPHAFSDI